MISAAAQASPGAIIGWGAGLIFVGACCALGAIAVFSNYKNLAGLYFERTISASGSRPLMGSRYRALDSGTFKNTAGAVLVFGGLVFVSFGIIVFTQI